ncbi:MAG: dihydropteroate synthase [Gammaproteobacteria bacterium]
MRDYFRPIVQSDTLRPDGALPLAGGRLWFAHAERLNRSGVCQPVPARDVPEPLQAAICSPRADICGLSLDRPRLMGVLNVTPDSFSDGGRFNTPDAALKRTRQMVKDGAEIIDIGGESTRPGADEVGIEEELQRTIPAITALRAAGEKVPISIDTRKAAVAREAISFGARFLNDVSALSHDSDSLRTAASLRVPVCLMHAAGDPKTMQDDPRYQNVLLDVFDFLEKRIEACEAAGIARSRIVVDPGIGFGKTLAHNLALLRGLSLFHGLGCPILLGASRKRFIGEIGGEPAADRRGPGSVAVALEAVRQGVQIVRVHDVAETAQAVAVWWRLVSG